MHGKRSKRDRIGNGAWEGRSKKKARAADMADRMELVVRGDTMDVVGRLEPTVRGHTTDTADLEAMMVRVEGTGMLEVEDEVEQGRQGPVDLDFITISVKSHLFSFLGTYR